MTSGLSSETVKPEDFVLIYFDRKRMFLARAKKGRQVASDRGVIRAEDLIGKPFGTDVTTSINYKAWILKPLMIDYMERGLRRVTQVIYPKDLGLIVLLLGVGPGARVLEVGVGTGNATAVLASLVRPSGHVYGYEIREEFLRIARANLEMLGLSEFVTLHLRDAREGIIERNLDCALVDIPDPWNLLQPLHEALAPSAPAAFFLPTVNQVLKLYEALHKHGGYVDIRCYEALLREWEPSLEALRPRTLMVGHTGYLLFARKVLIKC